MSDTCADCGGPVSAPAVTRCWACYVAQRRQPGAELDPVVVDRLCGGIGATATVAERAEAVRILTDRGLSAAEIARRVRLSDRAVVRYRRRNRVAA